MTELMQQILQNESPSQISDLIKSELTLRAMEKIDGYRPEVAADLFNSDEE
jgi:hypothetical protein